MHTSYYDKVYELLWEFSPVCVIRHFFLILSWRIRQILLYVEETNLATQSRHHGEISPPNRNMKHYKSVEFYKFLECQAPLRKRKAPIEDLLTMVVPTAH